MSEIQDSVVTLALFKYETLLKKNIDIDTRTITVCGIINDKMFMNIDSAFSLLEQQGSDPITVRIISAGGYTYEALGIIGRFNRSKCAIHTEGYGHIQSAATLLLAAGKKRSISAECTVMTHQASYAVEGKHRDIVNYVAQASREEMAWAENMAKRTKQDVTYWIKLHRKGLDKYLTSTEAVQLGIADEVF